MSEPPANDQPLAPQQDALESLDRIRAILLRDDRQEVDRLARSTHLEVAALRAEVRRLHELISALESEKADATTIVPEIEAALSGITASAVTQDHQEMAQALGPVMAEATRVQIAHDEDDMREALAPVMFGAIQQAIRDAFRDLTRQIDARLRATTRRFSLRERFSLGMRGVTPSSLALRNALPYEIQEVFLIHNQSGLLLAHHSAETEPNDSDLISAMLTAIRDFVGDAFLEGDDDPELQEVQYGDETIIIKSGRAAYCAVVVEGTEPTGLRSRLQTFVWDLHNEYGSALLAYDGDPDTIPDLRPQLAELNVSLGDDGSQEPALSAPPSRGLVAGLGCGGLATIVLLCFAVWMTMRLLPVAFANGAFLTPQPTATALPTQTNTPPPSPTLAPSRTPSPEPTDDSPFLTMTAAVPTAVAQTLTAQPSPTPLPSATATDRPTSTPTPTPEATPLVALTTGTVWVLAEPVLASEQLYVIPEQAQVEIEALFGEWVQVRYPPTSAAEAGWMLRRWLDLPDTVPGTIITPQGVEG